MHVVLDGHPHAKFVLEHEDHRENWQQLLSVLKSIEPDDVINVHLDYALAQFEKKKKPRVGLQDALNKSIDSRLRAADWTPQPPLFEKATGEYSMDFVKSGLGVEVAFNNVSYFPWIFLRLNMAGQDKSILPESQIHAGVFVVATQELKAWGGMDATVGTLNEARRLLSMIDASIRTPIALLGLGIPTDESWGPKPPFVGKGWWEASSGASYYDGSMTWTGIDNWRATST